jgi:hypothetical protein
MAAEAGIGQATVQRAERGHSVQMTSMIKLLRTLGLLGGLDLAIPESIALPIAQLDRQQRRIRQRARGGRGGGAGRATKPTKSTEPTEERWRWGSQREPGR